MKNKYRIGILIFMAFMTLYGCGNVLKGENIDTNKNVNLAPDDDLSMDEKQSVAEGNSHVNHTNSGIVPKGVKKAQNPTYPVGSQVIIQADHMVGMKGAKGIIVGAYNTNAYAVTYEPTTGGEEVKNHKWVIQEEIKKAQDKILQPGAKVTLEADHLPGMKGAIATVESGIHTTVYMVNYKPTNGTSEVKNHKWLIESEIEADQS
ncbi:YdhK family protein [Rummeliibacillus suwonensis]|uniref:YdhK family protein n=1 Tax=Rummeliibacillus suwonensis TaxID=1306154 RepID=UPI001FB87BFD|nr:YdhK family protein [Rummeliibacillus suwonensis]